MLCARFSVNVIFCIKSPHGLIRYVFSVGMTADARQRTLNRICEANFKNPGACISDFCSLGGKSFCTGTFRTTRVLQSQNTYCRRNCKFRDSITGNSLSGAAADYYSWFTSLSSHPRPHRTGARRGAPRGSVLPDEPTSTSSEPGLACWSKRAVCAVDRPHE